MAEERKPRKRKRRGPSRGQAKGKGPRAKGGDKQPLKDGELDEWLSTSGNVRCTYTRATGERCRKWALPGSILCRTHGRPMPRKPRYQFRTDALRKLYDQYLADPDYLDVSDELALIRVAAQSMAASVQRRMEKDEREAPTAAEAALLSQAAEDVSTLVERCARIEKHLEKHVQISTIDQFLRLMVDVLVRRVKDTGTLVAVLEDLRAVEIPVGARLRLQDFPEGSPEREHYERVKACAVAWDDPPDEG